MEPTETVPTSVETPSEAPITAPPAESTEPANPTAEPVVELFDLPDGRKVDAVTLTKEWKENFLPEYTRKSQALAAKESPLPTETTNNPVANPDWIPTSYGELIEVAKQAFKQDLVAEEQARVERQQAIENEVARQIGEVKKLDATVNENALFQHATKYGFNNLSVAYQNMKDMNLLVKNVQETTVKNIVKRNDPVSMSPGANGSRPDPSGFQSAIDYLRSLNSN